VETKRKNTEMVIEEPN